MHIYCGKVYKMNIIETDNGFITGGDNYGVKTGIREKKHGHKGGKKK